MTPAAVEGTVEKERQALARIQTQSLGLLRSSSLIKMTENSLVVGWWRWTRTICSHGAHLASFVFAFSSLGLPHTLSSIICFILFSQNRRGHLLAKDVAKEWSAYLLQIFFPQSCLRHQ